MTLKHLKVLPKHVQNKIYTELELHDKLCHQHDLSDCLGQLLFKRCLDCEMEFYYNIDYAVITLYFQDHIRCINQDDPLFITCFQLLKSDNIKHIKLI